MAVGGLEKYLQSFIKGLILSAQTSCELILEHFCHVFQELFVTISNLHGAPMLPTPSQWI